MHQPVAAQTETSFVEVKEIRCSPGSLLMADQVRNMVYRVRTEDCSRPERG